jgi:hypothetical protein
VRLAASRIHRACSPATRGVTRALRGSGRRAAPPLRSPLKLDVCMPSASAAGYACARDRGAPLPSPVARRRLPRAVRAALRPGWGAVKLAAGELGLEGRRLRDRPFHGGAPPQRTSPACNGRPMAQSNTPELKTLRQRHNATSCAPPPPRARNQLPPAPPPAAPHPAMGTGHSMRTLG